MKLMIQSSLAPEESQGFLTLNVEPSSTVEQLIMLACQELQVTFSPAYVLKDQDNKQLEKFQTLADQGVLNQAVLILDHSDGQVKMKKPLFNKWWYLAGISLLIGSAGIITTSILRKNQDHSVYKYSIVFDAGSTHTKLFIYSWEGSKTNGTAVVKQSGTFKMKSGKPISYFTHNVSGAGESLKPHLDFAMKSIPADHIQTTPVFLGATAGMRLLKKSNSNLAEAIMKSVRETIQTYPFQFTQPTKQAKIISGFEEGTFSWITANYLSGKLGLHSPKFDLYAVDLSSTFGALDMGGASTQVTFMPSGNISMPKNYNNTLLLYGRAYKLYTHSYLCYGINEAARQLKAKLVVAQSYKQTIQNPCWPKGNSTSDPYSEVFEAPCTRNQASRLRSWVQHPESTNVTFIFKGQSNYSQCAQTVEQLFNFSEICHYPRCSFNGKYQPPVAGDFLAFSTFYYLSSFLNLTSPNMTVTVSLQKYMDTVKNWCNKTWDQIKDISNMDHSLLPLICFEGIYIQILLTKGYGFNSSNWQSVHFMNKIGRADIGWSLGFMIDTSNQIPAEFVKVVFGMVTFILLTVLFTLFILIAVGFACYAAKHYKQKRTGSYTQLLDDKPIV